MFRNVRFRAEALCSIIKADLALESISTLCAKDARAFVKELLIYFVSSIAEAMIGFRCLLPCQCDTSHMTSSFHKCPLLVSQQKALPLPLPMALPMSLMLKHLSCHQRMFTCAESDDRRG